MSTGNIELAESFTCLREFRKSFYPLIAVMAALFLLTAVFWTIWQAFGLSIPEIFGVSRFWLDSIGLPFCFLYFLFGIGFFVTNFNDFVNDEEASRFLSFAFAMGPPFILSLIFATSLVFSFSAGLAIFLALTFLALAVFGLYKIFALCCFFLLNFLDRIFRGSDEEDDLFN